MHQISSNETESEDISEPAIMVDMGAFPPRYRDVSLIGSGSRSLIFSVIDQMDQTNLRRIAVKKVAVHGEKKESMFRQLLREIRIMNRLDHQNIVKIHHVLVSTANDYPESPPNACGDFQQIDFLYLGMELMDTSLRNILEKSHLDREYIKLFMYQILRGTKYLHSANVIHRDLTPSNVLINMDTLMLKIGDFGVSRLLDYEYDHTYHLSLPLTTKYYQAPELLLHPHHYTKGMDVWSIGCIFLEMVTGSIAFPGENAYEQMTLILDTVPVTESDWQSAVSAGCMDENCCPSSSNYSVQENGGCPTNPLENWLFDIDSTGINLLKQMLLFDSALRIDAEDSIAHPYFVSYSNPNDEPSCARPFHIEDEIDECCTNDLQAMLHDISYSVTSSFSRSTDAASHAGQSDRMDELNSLGVSSSNSIVANGSYRHLLSLAENTQGDVLSESEVRNIAVDLDYGVQIHECSLNKDRMSIDIRPASTSAACFDPYKWDHSSNSTVNSVAGKQLMMVKSSSKMNRSLEEVGRNSESTLITSVHKSCWSMDVSIGNNIENHHWSVSSLELSSEIKKKLSGNSTPDSADRPAEVSSGTITPITHSPAEMDRESVASQRHNDSQPHQSSRRHHHDSHHSHHHHHHHHRHHHHHHHHHHHKHKNRHGHSSTSNHGKNGIVEVSTKTAEDASAERLFQALSDMCKSEKYSNDDESPISRKPITKEKVKMPFKENEALCNGNPVHEHSVENTTHSSESLMDNAKHTHFANIEGSLTHSKNSAFSRHLVSSKSANKVKCNDNSSSIIEHNHRTPNLAIPKSTRLMESFDKFSKDMEVDKSVNEMRPRTWSAGCPIRNKKAIDLWRLQKLMNNSLTDDLVTDSIVEKICTRFNKYFNAGQCFKPDLNPKKPHSDQENILWQSRRRHFSDDPTLMSSAKCLMAESTDNGRTVSNVPLITCHTAARAGPQSRSRLECPF